MKKRWSRRMRVRGEERGGDTNHYKESGEAMLDGSEGMETSKWTLGAISG